jgi:5-methylcytosine-specific restriction protein A
VIRLSEHRKAAARLYRSGQWQALRRQQLTLQPFCAECLRTGKYTLASEVDHVVPHRNDEALFYDPLNLQSLCHPCHSQKTVREDGGFGRARHIEDEVGARERTPFR